MDIDIAKLRTKVPLDSLNEFSLRQLPGILQVVEHQTGERLFNIGDLDHRSYYLIDGCILMADQDGRSFEILANSDSARYPLSNLKPRRFSATVCKPSARLIQFDSDALEKLITWSQLTQGGSREPATGISVDEAEQEESWIARMFQSRQFLRLPAANIETLLSRLEDIEARAGTAIVRQGDPGDYFYFISHGRANVLRRGPKGEIKLAELKTGDSFGEEALIADVPRNASVVAIEDCQLKRLAKPDFEELLKEPFHQFVSLEQTVALLKSRKAVMLDVRTEDEYHHDGIKPALNIPLYRLRLHIPKLRRDISYIVCCDSEVRSSAAAFLLNRFDFDAYILRGGLAALTQGAASEPPA